MFTDGPLTDPLKGPVISTPVGVKHKLQQEKLKKAGELFEKSPFNKYIGPPKPQILIITSSACFLYSREAVSMLGLQKRVGILKLGCTWPLPEKLLKKYLRLASKIMVVEEVLPFMEENIKVLAASYPREIGAKTFHGKIDGTFPSVGELNPDMVAQELAKIMKVKYKTLPASYARELQKSPQ